MSECIPIASNCEFDSINVYQQANCTCPPGFTGTACQNVAPTQGCNAMFPIYDSVPINIASSAPKSFECFLGYNEAVLYAVRLHKASMTVQLNKTGHGNAQFLLSSRHRNITTEQCGVLQSDIACSMDECYGTTDKVTGTATLKCQTGTCSSCGDYDTECSTILRIFADNLKPPFVFQFSDIQPYTSTGGLSTMQYDTSMTLFTFACQTGRCVDTPVNQNFNNDCTLPSAK